LAFRNCTIDDHCSGTLAFQGCHQQTLVSGDVIG